MVSETADLNKQEPFISVVVPVFNEEENIPELLKRIWAGLSETGWSFEVIVIDDGSTDRTAQILREQKRLYPELRVVIFRKNFGQSAAMTAGFDLARGSVVVTMDGDLQNDPADIPRLVEKLQEGYDVVSGWRKDRKDAKVSRLLPSKIANWLIGRTTGVRLHDYGCSLKAYRSEISKNLLLYGELHRFIPVLASFQGARIAEVVVTHHPRTRGKSKYGIGRTYRVLLDLMLMLFFQKFATRPLQFFGLAGGLMFVAGMLIELYLTAQKLFFGQDIGGRPLLLFGVLLIISGLMLFCIGLLAELIIRTYYEASGKRIYAIREIIE
ncbi:MAG: glycosyltransferase family 2 protein [Thermodesulfobacteria bacterium]|nr:glycosyltransferase family 2 protein [Thermodesulfobacteriota bacterium]